MRRQLKPFVTEYRGGLRRGKDAAGAAETNAEPLRSRVFEEAQRIFQPDHGEDSYEAALRAADALFARAPQQALPEQARKASDPTAAVEEMPVRPARDDRSIARHEPASDAGETRAGRWAPEEPTAPLLPDSTLPTATESVPPRRILQAIEPPEENRFAALEAERAPKRRGRKPGSKNKPKVVIGDDWPTFPLRIAKAASTVRAANGVDAAYDTSLDDEVLDDEVADEGIVGREMVVGAGVVVSSSEDAESANADDPSADSQPRGRNDKFTRKRAGLRPGERWKRRLPKAAW